MFDIGATELLVLAIVAILVIGPKDLPLALRTVGRWVSKIRQVSTHFRTGLDAMVREAEIEEMDKKWKERNAQIMADHPADEMGPLEASAPPPSAAEAKAAIAEANPPKPEGDDTPGKPASQPGLPLDERD
ncbi:Sec-independent protein translocase protein TatB [Parerythrobacter jejuensis]|uniref:Sec-independent protein translocase protein TatB n=1 Tax=Parerythrobacter jejuensis TaxID=795812 RepID=A0A845ASW9_9SPHN|nr:Sec-independent protein translocase protein TatB [Parerythrobacter jejuensis]MXP31606.1 twin-arginine translocase subunit TatB [Parerythrobacter jejuensis]